jgi:hypothetical protein
MLQEKEIYMYISRWAFMGGAPGASGVQVRYRDR